MSSLADKQNAKGLAEPKSVKIEKKKSKKPKMGKVKIKAKKKR